MQEILDLFFLKDFQGIKSHNQNFFIQWAIKKLTLCHFLLMQMSW